MPTHMQIYTDTYTNNMYMSLHTQPAPPLAADIYLEHLQRRQKILDVVVRQCECVLAETLAAMLRGDTKRDLLRSP